MPLDSLKGKVIWITGASSGIGEHIAIRLAKSGVKLVLSGRRKEELKRVKDKCLGNVNFIDSCYNNCPVTFSKINIYYRKWQRFEGVRCTYPSI